MASVEFIQKRIAGKEKEIEKLSKKLERIHKAQATNWEVNPYYYHESDLKWCLKDIEEAEKALEGYKAQLERETEKANSRDVKVIIDFLEMWKANVRKYYTAGLKDFYFDAKMVRNAYRNYANAEYGTPERDELKKVYEDLEKQFRIDRNGLYESRQYTDNKGRTRRTEVKIADGKYEAFEPYNRESNIEEALARLEKDLVQEANRKYDFIIERTNAIVGQITDASNLYIGAKADLNGYIIGTKGTAKVQTIGAGGYNIQCYHFRTLINAMK